MAESWVLVYVLLIAFVNKYRFLFIYLLSRVFFFLAPEILNVNVNSKAENNAIIKTIEGKRKAFTIKKKKKIRE